MIEKLNVILANPAGNKTIFVLDPCSQDEYKEIGKRILEKKELQAEQVGFLCPPKNGGQGRMEMCGQEFCGNASRSYGLYLAKLLGIDGSGSVVIEVSGNDENLEVQVDTSSCYTRLSMPISGTIIHFPLPSCETAKLVPASGIYHVVVFDLPATLENFNTIKSTVQARFDPPGIGAMFYDTIKKSLTPVVWVRDVDSTYFEGSCGSGSVATAAVLSREIEDGNLLFTLPQPQGTLEINIIKENGILKEAFLQGVVELGTPFEIIL